MKERFDSIDSKLDKIAEALVTMKVEHHGRITKIETTQKGVIALCVALITTALGALAKSLNLG